MLIKKQMSDCSRSSVFLWATRFRGHLWKVNDHTLVHGQWHTNVKINKKTIVRNFNEEVGALNFGVESWNFAHLFRWVSISGFFTSKAPCPSVLPVDHFPAANRYTCIVELFKHYEIVLHTQKLDQIKLQFDPHLVILLFWTSEQNKWVCWPQEGKAIHIFDVFCIFCCKCPRCWPTAQRAG